MNERICRVQACHFHCYHCLCGEANVSILAFIILCEQQPLETARPHGSSVRLCVCVQVGVYAAVTLIEALTSL